MMARTDSDFAGLCEQVLKFWFGEPDGESGELKYRGGLWWRGISPDRPAGSPKLSPEELRQETDTLIAERFRLETLLEASVDEMSSALIPGGPLDEWCSREWRHRVAAVIVLDQFTRNAFRGTGRMFAYDRIAQKVAADALLEYKANLQGSAAPQWPLVFFLNVALMHSEDIDMVRHSVDGIRSLIEELSTLGEPYKRVVMKMGGVEKAAVSHYAMISRFGRYPYRNSLLGRASTPEEEKYVSMGELPTWATSVFTPKSGPQQQHAAAQRQTRGTDNKLKVLVLHSNRQTVANFTKRTRGAFAPLKSIANLVYVAAPHDYVASGDSRVVSEVSGESENDSRGLCWFNASDDPSTMVYNGIEESIAYIDKYAKLYGPFDGIIGFSQGGFIAGLLAALQHDKSLMLQHLSLRFVVSISGFYCRDTRPAFSQLHLAHVPESHHSDAVKTRTEKIKIPSFHVWGAQDDLIVNWRSEKLADCFEKPETRIHPGRHFSSAVRQWPIAEMKEWMETFVKIQSDSTDQVSAFRPLPERIGGLRSSQASAAAEGTPRPLQLPSMKHGAAIEESNLWQRLVAAGPRATLEPQEAGFRQSDVDSFVSGLSSRDGSSVSLLEDLFVLSCAIFPPSLSSEMLAKRLGAKKRAVAGQLSVWLWAAMFYMADAVLPFDEVEKEFLRFLGLIPTFSSWDLLIRLDLLVCTGSDQRDGFPRDAQREMPNREVGAKLHNLIAQTFADTLVEDFRRASLLAQNLSTRDQLKDDSVLLPTQASLYTPRSKAFVDKRTKLARHVALYIVRHQDRQDVMALDDVDDHKNRAFLNRRYRQVWTKVRDVLLSPMCDPNARIRADREAKNAFKRDNMQPQGSLEELLQRPLADAVVNPRPEPVDISAAKEFAPLHAYLRANTTPSIEPEAELHFPRGALCGDGRLDMCKQVIGPGGVKDLMDTLAVESEFKRVKSILLGNNIAGDGLGFGVSDLIASGMSSIKVWYIAGNRLTATGVQPICKVLMHDKQVEQLWLKRNPLHAAGALHIAELLKTNRHIKVLDLVTCGLMDQGLDALLQGLEQNTSLEHLYLCGNGFSAAGAKRLAEYLRSGKCNLIGLYLSCNRFGDQGAEAIFDALQSERASSIQRIDLSSCGIGIGGARAAAALLRKNTNLRRLNLGFSRMCYALGEVRNRIGHEGAIEIAESLSHNTNLLGLSVFHNDVYQPGFEAFRNLLAGTDTVPRNSTLVELLIEQNGVPFNELTREDIRASITRNQGLVPPERRALVEEALNPAHLKDIISVYRVGNSYADSSEAVGSDRLD